jgi:hypothetical protein
VRTVRLLNTPTSVFLVNPGLSIESGSLERRAAVVLCGTPYLVEDVLLAHDFSEVTQPVRATDYLRMNTGVAPRGSLRTGLFEDCTLRIGCGPRLRIEYQAAPRARHNHE